MALEGEPVSDHKPELIWENNPDTPITSSALSKNTDLVVSYLDFKYNDPELPLHYEGKILMTDPSTSNPIRLVLKRGIVFSIINQIDETTSPNEQYKIFDTGLDDIWITHDNRDNLYKTTVGWGQNKQWFIFICDEMINNDETRKNSAQILLSQSSKSPQNTQIPGTTGTTIFYSEKNTRLIGGFKSNETGIIVKDSLWDISGKFHTIKSKKYMILDEYSVAEGGQHIYRPLRVSDLDSSGIESNISGNLNVYGNIYTSLSAEITNEAKIGSILIKDTYNTNHIFNKITSSSGIALRADINPSPTNPIFSVRSADQSERLRVEHDGAISTSNNTIKINGVSITKELTTPTGTDTLGINAWVYATRVYNAVYNDLAEYFLSDDKLVAGKVYSLDKERKVKITAKKGDHKVIGICSDSFGYVLKSEYEKDGIPLALAGTILAWTKTLIQQGDELMSDTDGFVCKAGFIQRIFMRGAIIGKALESSSDINEKRILVLVR